MNSVAKSKFKRIRNNFFLFIASILVAMIIGELMVRIFVEQETKRLAAYDKELGWTGKPNGEGVYIRVRDNIKTAYSYNNLGFRDDDFDSLDDDRERIAILGDSFIESLEIPYEDIFHEQFETRLQRQNPAIDVVALGSQGYSTAQELLAFRKFKDEINPDIVWLIFYTGNDFQDNGRKAFAYLSDNNQLVFPKNDASWLKIKYLTFKRWIYEHSHAVFFIKNLLESHANLNLATATKSNANADSIYQLEITRKLIEQLNEEVTQAGMRFGVVVIPFRDDIIKKDFENSEIIVNFCKEKNISYLNLAENLRKEHFFENDIHFTKSGHNYVTNQLLDFYKAFESY